MSQTFLNRYKSCLEFSSIHFSTKCDSISAARNWNFIFISLSDAPFETSAPKCSMTPGWPNSLPEPAGSLRCVHFESVRGTQIKSLSFFGGKLTCGWWLRKGYCYSEIRRPGWGPLIHVPGSRRKGPQGAVHTHRRHSDKFSVICTPISFFTERVCS